MLRRFPGSILTLLLALLACAVVVGPVSGLAATPASATSSAAASGTTTSLPSLRSPTAVPSGAPLVAGTIQAPGGPYLVDRDGRVVFFHGVNAVYKYPPYVLFADRGKPWNFSTADASLMARLGFNVVRLGMTWKGLEPGTAPANDPAICAHGAPANPNQFNRAVFDRYIARLTKTVDLLGRFHIYTILDMHQDVYNEMFEGEGEPNWAVCTNHVPNVDPPGRWSLEYSTQAAGVAFSHFWRNNVKGDLQGEYDRIWGLVAKSFRANPWILGYDPFNEPFSTSLIRFGDAHFDAELECFYTGTGHIGSTLHGAPLLKCPKDDPADGVVPTILANDPGHLIFDEPDNYASRGYPTYLGPMDLPNLVYNAHIYCGARSPVTGNPTNVDACADQERHSLLVRAADRPAMASPYQPGGPAWFVTEFGATSDPALIASVTAQMNAEQVGWTYWAWKYYGDPTGSADESLVMADGRLRSTALVLSQVYPQAVAGTPVSFAYSPLSDVFTMAYLPNHRVHAPTVIFVPTELHYQHGYCATVRGARVTSGAGSDHLVLQNARAGGRVTVRVAPGRCARGS
ncbi:MAG TPA: cellulase family glycosylhydrolase [Acidimicrobiales bacterium]|nr:cellulase family glycosylhydrolase [Acidimicrobiales bacterium]